MYFILCVLPISCLEFSNEERQLITVSNKINELNLKSEGVTGCFRTDMPLLDMVFMFQATSETRGFFKKKKKKRETKK